MGFIRFIAFSYCALFLFIYTDNSYANCGNTILCGGVSQYSSLGYLSGIEVNSSTPGQWVSVGSVSLPKYSTMPSQYNCNASSLCTFSGVNIGYNGISWVRPFVNLYNPQVTLTGDNGETYTFQFALTFPSEIILGMTSLNSANNRTWNVQLGTNTYPSGPEKLPFTWTYSDLNHGGYCGALGNCQWFEMLYLHTSTPNPTLWIKIPSNLTASTFSFSNLKMMTLSNIARNNAGTASTPSVDASLYISGQFSLPQRCYTNISTSNISFGDVKPNDPNGLIGTKDVILTSNCYNAPVGTKHYIFLNNADNSLAFSGGGDALYFPYLTDSAGVPSFGIVAGINNNPDCSFGSSNARFRKEYLMRTISSLSKLTYNDAIKFGLCKFSNPTSYGQQKGVIKITTRWEKS
jgi:hypothetical protein